MGAGIFEGQERALPVARLAAQLTTDSPEGGPRHPLALALGNASRPGARSYTGKGSGKLSGFTLDRLFRFINTLDLDEEVIVKKADPG